MAQQIIDVAVEAIEVDQIIDSDLARTAAEGGYTAYRLVPIGSNGRRQSVAAQMIWHFNTGRAGISWGADAIWTDAFSPTDAAERFFSINDKEVSN